MVKGRCPRCSWTEILVNVANQSDMRVRGLMNADREHMAHADINAFPRARGSRIKPHRVPKTSLSPRETEICKLLVVGMKVREVALQLNITIGTAWRHSYNAYVKLDVQVHDRSGLVRHRASPNVSLYEMLSRTFNPFWTNPAPLQLLLRERSYEGRLGCSGSNGTARF
jgi:DNA-binding CsgD family transcriptional regulator